MRSSSFMNPRLIGLSSTFSSSSGCDVGGRWYTANLPSGRAISSFPLEKLGAGAGAGGPDLPRFTAPARLPRVGVASSSSITLVAFVGVVTCGCSTLTLTTLCNWGDVASAAWRICSDPVDLSAGVSPRSSLEGIGATATVDEVTLLSLPGTQTETEPRKDRLSVLALSRGGTGTHCDSLPEYSLSLLSTRPSPLSTDCNTFTFTCTSISTSTLPCLVSSWPAAVPSSVVPDFTETATIE